MTAMAISMSPDWLDSYTEQPVDPTRPIVDPHHHLWPPGLPLTYGVDELVADTGSGHNICLLYTSPSPRDLSTSRMPSSA